MVRLLEQLLAEPLHACVRSGWRCFGLIFVALVAPWMRVVFVVQDGLIGVTSLPTSWNLLRLGPAGWAFLQHKRLCGGTRHLRDLHGFEWVVFGGEWCCFVMGTLKNRQRGQQGMEVTILLGSKSDMPVAEKCTKILDMFEVTYQLRVASAHRSPAFVESIIKDAEADGCKIFIAMAGLAAALPGAVAALTTKPVIGVPCGGRVPYDSLLSIVQLPPGVPAATVGVDRGDNAGYLATQILALADPAHAARLAQNKLDHVERVKAMDREVNGGV